MRYYLTQRAITLALICMLILSSQAILANVNEVGVITKVQVSGHDIISVWLDGADKNDECVNGGHWTINRTSDPLYKEKHTAILSAALQGKTVRLFHNTSWGCGNWNSNQVYYIQIFY